MKGCKSIEQALKLYTSQDQMSENVCFLLIVYISKYEKLQSSFILYFFQVVETTSVEMLPKVLVFQLVIYNSKNGVETKIKNKIAIQTELIFGKGFNFLPIKQINIILMSYI